MHEFDVIVVGGGHAGVEATLAVARMGKRVGLVSMDAGKLALMSCNPAIGGIGKSQLVKEVDALGGLMGEAIDATGIQFRRLNLSRGPAVWSTRVQADRVAYNRYVVEFIERQPNVEVVEGSVTALSVESSLACGVILDGGEQIGAKAVVISSGTFLGGLIHIGEKQISGGRMGERAANGLSESLSRLGFEVGRLKTGTPPRLDGSSIDWSQCERQDGEDPLPLFSHRSKREMFEQTPCHLTRTTDKTKAIVSANYEKSPIFSGQIQSTGPRYCPSIEDKFFRFKEKPTHQIFLEPEGNGTDEVYPNGFSTALPEGIQGEAIRTIIGLEEATITQPGYAIEYDYCPAYQIDRSLETRPVKRLYFAGQINGTSGYEEAAAQGLMAGVNAVLAIDGEPAFSLDRSRAYIGVMIDDLTTRSTTEPYRMFTSRAEYRLALREDNARDRLAGFAKQYGLIPPTEFEAFERLVSDTESEVKLLRSIRVEVSRLADLNLNMTRRERLTMADLLKQPKIGLPDILPLLESFEGMFSDDMEVLERAAIRIRYQGYINKQEREIQKFRKQEAVQIPGDFVYSDVAGLKAEAKEKLSRFRPMTLGQAGKIEGITAGDLVVLAVNLRKYNSSAG